MNNGIQNSQKAIQLRRLGYSYTDISKELKVSRTSVCNWVKNVRLTESEKNILHKMIQNKISRARLKASISLHARKIFKEKKSFENAEKSFKKNIKDPLFSLGLGLYMGKGTIKGGNIQFTSSNEELIQLFLLWIEKYLEITRDKAKYRLFLDSFSKYKEKDYENAWIKILCINGVLFNKSVYNTYTKNTKKMANYKGSLSIVITNIEALRTVISWQKLLIQYYRA